MDYFKEQSYVSDSDMEMLEIARAFGKNLRPGDVVAYTGPMGAGKTLFTKGIAQALCAGDVVSSPTFAIMNAYSGKYPIRHFDMYRVSGWEDLYSTGFFEEQESGEAVLLIEWSENIREFLPPNVIKVDLRYGETENRRLIRIYQEKGGEAGC